MHRPRYWLRLVTDLNHKKRSMEALRACEQALAEAENPPTVASCIGDATQLLPGPNHGNGGGGDSGKAAASAEAAAILPLGECLPLLRRAVRLAVPPLRWRKRPPPQLRDARLRVMSLDLSWRRGGGGDGGSSSLAPRAVLAGPASASSTEDLRANRPEPNVMSGEEGDDGEEYKGGVGRGDIAGGISEGQKGSATIVPGTSLEQAVLDTMLAELGPEWTGLHAENRQVLFWAGVCDNWAASLSLKVLMCHIPPRLTTPVLPA